MCIRNACLVLLVLGCVLVTSGYHAYAFPQEASLDVVVEAGRFTLKQRYRSMEGPEFIFRSSVEDLLKQKKIVLPESSQRLIQNPTKKLPSHQIPLAPFNASVKSQPTKLYWLRGAKLEVLDEHGKVIPDAEFLCHAGIEVNCRLHQQLFPNSSRCYGNRVLTFTQGITNIMLPAGYGVPLANTEKILVVLRALNQTSDRPRRVRLRCTMYFAADQEAKTQISALNWTPNGVLVVIDKHAGNSNRSDICESQYCMRSGEDAPNDIGHRVYHRPFFKTQQGQKATGHWVIPLGRSTWRTAIIDPYFGSRGTIRAVVAHVHPFCEKFCLIELKDKQPEHILWTVHSSTSTTDGIRLKSIDYLRWTGVGITLSPNARYLCEVTYNNTSGVKQDAMAIAIIYFYDPKFKKPIWSSTLYSNRNHY